LGASLRKIIKLQSSVALPLVGEGIVFT